MRTWTLVLLTVAGIAIAIYAFAPLRMSALVLLGRSPVCPLAQAVRSPANMKEQIAIKDRILKASKLVERDPAGYHLWNTPKGAYWIPRGSDFSLPFNLAEQERHIYGSGEHFIRSGDVVLDCGANVGVFTREALKAGARVVVAIEPAPENIESLKRNFADEIRKGSVIVYPKGVWDKDDFLKMQVDAHNSAADSFVMHPKEATESTQTFPLTTIDRLVAELNLPRVDFIKMDIEGAETRALKGGAATLAKWHPRLAISAYHQPEHPVEVPKTVRAAWSGYQMECGPCATDNAIIRPDILYFH